MAVDWQSRQIQAGRATQRNQAIQSGLQNQLTQAQNDLRKFTDLSNQGLNPDGTPKDFSLRSTVDDNGNLLDKYRLNNQPNVNADQRAINAVRDRAMSQGYSPWALMALNRQKLDQSQQADQLTTQMGQTQNQAMNQLAMTGGLTSGARERLGQRSVYDQMMARQNLARQGQMDRMNIGMQDETNKQNMLGQVAGYDFQNAGLGMQNRAYQDATNRQNLASTFAGLDNINEANKFLYDQKMKKWAAGKSADAARSGASSDGGLLSNIFRGIGL